jgi:hypothetical protein
VVDWCETNKWFGGGIFYEPAVFRKDDYFFIIIIEKMIDSKYSLPNEPQYKLF